MSHLTSFIAFEVEAASTEECSHWIESIIELKTATTLNIHRSESNQKPMKVIKVWQIDNSLGNTSIRLAKFSIPEGKDTGVMMMEDLVPLEDEMSLDNYRDSLSMSNIGGYSKAVVDRTSSGPNKMSFRNRGESSGLPLPNTTAVNARSKSVTSSSTSSEPITFDDLHLSISSTNTKLSEQKMDVFAGEILVPTVASVEPPRLHSVWSTDFEDSSHKSLPRSVSSPEIRNSAGLTDLITSSSGLSPHNSVNVESAFQVKPASVGPVTNSASNPSKNMPSSMHKAQQPSFLDDDDLFEFLTSNSATSQTHATQLTPAHNTPQTCPPRSQSKRLVLDNEKFILRR